MPSESEKKDIELNREVAAFSYFLIFSPLLLYTRRDSPFIQFHARQAVILFFFFIILVFLGNPIAYGNFLIVGVCLTGIIQANQGYKWKVPIVADMIEGGVTPSSVWKALVHYFGVLKAVFTHSTQKKMFSALSENKNNGGREFQKMEKFITEQQGRISFLEKELIQKSVLRGLESKFLSPEAKKKTGDFIKAIAEKLPKSKKTADTHSVCFRDGDFEVIIGKYSEESLDVYFSGRPEKNLIPFGSFSGMTLSLGNKRDEERVFAILKKAMRKRG